jgi:hypothetical protein
MANVSIYKCGSAVAAGGIEKNGPNKEARAGNSSNDAQKGETAQRASRHLTHSK